jgi:hypothetical protein
MKKLVLVIIAVVVAASAGAVAIATGAGDHKPPIPTVKPPTRSLPGPFSGRGTTKLGTLTIPYGGAEVYWNTPVHHALSIPRLGVRARHGGDGQRFIAAGTYRHVVVQTTGHWTVRFGPRLRLH